MKTYILYIALLVLWCSAAFVTTTDLKGKVIAIKDGDTIVILTDKVQTTVRLEHIDCPEKKQAFGNASKKYISSLCFGKNVKIIGNGKKDRNGRLIGVIMLDTININQTMVKAGMAWHFKKYSKDKTYEQLEATARKSKVGLWKDANPIAPWDFRAKK